MKYATELGSCDMIYIPGFMKIGIGSSIIKVCLLARGT
jgi:hypothetical protein